MRPLLLLALGASLAACEGTVMPFPAALSNQPGAADAGPSGGSAWPAFADAGPRPDAQAGHADSGAAAAGADASAPGEDASAPGEDAASPAGPDASGACPASLADRLTVTAVDVSPAQVEVGSSMGWATNSMVIIAPTLNGGAKIAWSSGGNAHVTPLYWDFKRPGSRTTLQP